MKCVLWFYESCSATAVKGMFQREFCETVPARQFVCQFYDQFLETDWLCKDRSISWGPVMMPWKILGTVSFAVHINQPCVVTGCFLS
jgi:hypothetical protein